MYSELKLLYLEFDVLIFVLNIAIKGYSGDQIHVKLILFVFEN